MTDGPRVSVGSTEAKECYKMAVKILKNCAEFVTLQFIMILVCSSARRGMFVVVFGWKARCCFEFSSRPSYFAPSSHMVIKPDYKVLLTSCLTSSSPIFSTLFHPSRRPPSYFPSFFCTVSIFNSTESFEREGCCRITELKVITAWVFMSHPNARKVEVRPRQITRSAGYWAEVMRRVGMFISLSVQMFVCQSGWGDVCSVVEILWIFVRLHPIAWKRPNPAKYGCIIWTLKCSPGDYKNRTSLNTYYQ